ncbi:MAG: hypothetical protein IPK13_08560 [Deltaproteobacteria bacterium]|nr:hypothetical protein [Deltaproteobacteria bacterium]
MAAVLKWDLRRLDKHAIPLGIIFLLMWAAMRDRLEGGCMACNYSAFEHAMTGQVPSFGVLG